MIVEAPTCMWCKHYKGGRSCTAFDYIPDAIWIGGNPHTSAIGGETVTFEPSSDLSQEDLTEVSRRIEGQ